MDSNRRDNIKRFYDYLKERDKKKIDWHDDLSKEEWTRFERMMWEFSRLPIKDFLFGIARDWIDDEGHWDTRYFYWNIYFDDTHNISIDMGTIPYEDEECEEECVFSIFNDKTLLVADTLSLTEIVDRLLSVFEKQNNEDNN